MTEFEIHCGLSPPASEDAKTVESGGSTAARHARFGTEPEVTALIDVVEPFQEPVPGNEPNKAAIPFRTGATVMIAPGGLQLLSRLERDEGGVDRLAANLSYSVTAAAPIAEDESPTSNPGPRLTVAAALAGAGFLLTLRDFKSRKPGWSTPRSDRALRPRVRRCSLVLS